MTTQLNYILNRLIISVLFFISAQVVKADWRIIGSAVKPETQAILTQKPDNVQEYVWVGQLSNLEFKVTDGVKTYIHHCGDNDPLEQSITLREQADSSEPGLRLRYSPKVQYYKVTLTITNDSKKILVERLTPPQYLYIMGGPFNKNSSNWLLEDAVSLERDSENPFIFYYRGYIRYNSLGDLGGSFKFLVGKSWSENFHPLETGGDKPLQQATKMRLGGEDNKWSIPSDRSRDGYYVIKINTMDLSITIEQFSKDIDETPLSVFLTGNAMLCGWTNSSPIMMQKKEKGIYQWQGSVLQGQFKLLKARNSWAMCYVATTADEQIVLGKDHNLVYEFEYYNGGGNDYKFLIPQAGNYLFTINLNTMKLKVDNPATNTKDLSNNSNGVRIFSRYGKLLISYEKDQLIQSTVYTIDGKEISNKKFTRNTEIKLPKGFYLIVLNNLDGTNISNTKTIIY